MSIVIQKQPHGSPKITLILAQHPKTEKQVCGRPLVPILSDTRKHSYHKWRYLYEDIINEICYYLIESLTHIQSEMPSAKISVEYDTVIEDFVKFMYYNSTSVYKSFQLFR